MVDIDLGIKATLGGAYNTQKGSSIVAKGEVGASAKAGNRELTLGGLEVKVVDKLGDGVHANDDKLETNYSKPHIELSGPNKPKISDSLFNLDDEIVVGDHLGLFGASISTSVKCK